MALAPSMVLCDRHHLSFQNIPGILVEARSQLLPVLLPPLQPLIYTLSRGLPVLWKFHTNSTRRQVTFYVWLLSSSATFVGFTHVVEGVCTSVLFTPE